MYIVIDTLLMVKNRNGTSVHKFIEIKANTLQKQTRVHMPHLKKKEKEKENRGGSSYSFG